MPSSVMQPMMQYTALSRCARRWCVAARPEPAELYCVRGFPLVIRNTAHRFAVLGLQDAVENGLIYFSHLSFYGSFYRELASEHNLLDAAEIKRIFAVGAPDDGIRWPQHDTGYVASLVSRGAGSTNSEDADSVQETLAFCRGTLIKAGVLLTAAHCVDGRQEDSIYVAFDGEEGIKNFKATQVLLHPKYRMEEVLETRYDIALVRFAVGSKDRALWDIEPAKVATSLEAFHRSRHHPSSVIAVVSSPFLERGDWQKTWPQTFRQFELKRAAYASDVGHEMSLAKSMIPSFPRSSGRNLFFERLQYVTGESFASAEVFYGKLNKALKNSHGFYSDLCLGSEVMCLKAHVREDYVRQHTFMCPGDSGGAVLWHHNGDTQVIAVASQIAIGIKKINGYAQASQAVVVCPYLPWIISQVGAL